MQVIEITSLTGHSPYNISICDITLTYCYVVATGVVSVPPTLQLPIPPQLEGANQVLVVVTDAIGCQEFILQTCPTTPTPTPTITPTPTPTRIIICNCISFQNTTLGTLTFEYTQCDGKIFNGEIESGTTLYYCGRLPSAEVGVSISINDECIKNTCSDIYLTPTPTPSITPTVTPTPTVTNTPTVTPTPTITSTPTPTPTTPIIACLCYTLSNDPPPPPTPALGATNFQYVDCSGNTQNVTVFNGFPIDVCAQDSTVVRTGGDPGSIGPAIVDCCLTNPNCYYYDVTISSTDLATSTGNMIYPNNTVFVEYTDCNGGTVSTPYTVAGTYFNDICADDTQPITVLYYQNDLGYLTISSFVTQQGNCP